MLRLDSVEKGERAFAPAQAQPQPGQCAPLILIGTPPLRLFQGLASLRFQAKGGSRLCDLDPRGDVVAVQHHGGE